MCSLAAAMPGLNAVIRAVVKSAWNSGIECVGIEDSFDGLHRARSVRGRSPGRDVARNHATRRNDPGDGRTVAIPSSCRSRTSDGTRRLLRNASSRCSTRWAIDAAHRHRRRRHARHRPHFCRARAFQSSAFPNDRQRHRRHDELFRLRYGGRLRDRRDRPAAHDRRSAPAHPGRRGDGTRFGMDRALRRSGRRRGRDPDSGNSVRPGAGRASGCRERDRWGARFSIVVVTEGAFPEGRDDWRWLETAEGATSSGLAASEPRCATRCRC